MGASPPGADPAQDAPRGWREALAVYRHPRVVGMAFLGFSAGLPFLLVFSTLSAWLREAEVTRTAIGFFSWVGLTYSLKALWAPVVDRLALPWLTASMGRRRSWMLLAMLGIAAGLVGMAFTDPRTELARMAAFAVLVAFSSATQDVAMDAYRIEAVERSVQGAMAATYQFGYRIALLAAGAGALLIADGDGWRLAYLAMAGLTLVGILTVLRIAEPEPSFDRAAERDEARIAAFLARHPGLPPWLRDLASWFLGAVAGPFVDFFSRYRLTALAILAFIGLFRLSDILMGVMANPFYIDLGFTLAEIAEVVKVYGFAMTLAGAFAGGVLVARRDVALPLVLAAFAVPLTNLLFAWLATVGPDLGMLILVISAENFSSGFAGSVFIAYLSGLTSARYTATQYALFSSVMTLPGKLAGGFSGMAVDAAGYFSFFVMTAAAGIPAILLALWLAPRTARRRAPDGPEEAAGRG